MSLIVACPFCQSRYNLPEKLAGKKVKCKACGKPFLVEAGNKVAATSAANNQPATNAPAREKQAVDSQELARMGLGAIRPQADPFAAPPTPGPDPLRNHVVHDPGFGVPGEAAAGMPGFGESGANEIDPDYESVVSNPYIKAPAKPSGHDAHEPSGEPGRKGKKRKKKVHPAVKDSLDQATMTLLIIGILIAMIFGFFFISAHSDAVTSLNNINKFNVEAGGESMSDEEINEAATEIAAGNRIFHGIGVSIGIVFMLLGVGVQFFPITCTILGLLGYIFFEAIVCIFLFDFISMGGWLRRFVICGALGKAFMSAMNARYYDQMMEERRRSGR